MKHCSDYTFWDRVVKSDGCWMWTGPLTKGYGQLRRDGKLIYAHRLSWILANGPIPDGLLVLHRCDVPACVRPSHLWLGTDLDNARDKHAKGRAGCIKPTHCKHGHEFTASNTYTHVERGITKRQCRECRRRIDRERWPKRRHHFLRHPVS